MPLNVVDLIGIPYKEHGRDRDGLDCYGVAIIVEHRLGKELRDIWYDNHSEEMEQEHLPTLNVSKTDKIEVGNILEMTINKELHIGVIISESTFIHATRNQGVRISRIGVIPIRAIYEVVDNGNNQSL